MSSVQVQVSDHMPFLLLDAMLSNYSANVTLNGNTNCDTSSGKGSVSCAATSATEFKCTITCTPASTPIDITSISVVVTAYNRETNSSSAILNTTWSCSISNVADQIKMDISQTISIQQQ